MYFYDVKEKKKVLILHETIAYASKVASNGSKVKMAVAPYKGRKLYRIVSNTKA